MFWNYNIQISYIVTITVMEYAGAHVANYVTSFMSHYETKSSVISCRFYFWDTSKCSCFEGFIWYCCSIEPAIWTSWDRNRSALKRTAQKKNKIRCILLLFLARFGRAILCCSFFWSKTSRKSNGSFPSITQRSSASPALCRLPLVERMQVHIAKIMCTVYTRVNR